MALELRGEIPTPVFVCVNAFVFRISSKVECIQMNLRESSKALKVRQGICRNESTHPALEALADAKGIRMTDVVFIGLKSVSPSTIVIQHVFPADRKSVTILLFHLTLYKQQQQQRYDSNNITAGNLLQVLQIFFSVGF